MTSLMACARLDQWFKELLIITKREIDLTTSESKILLDINSHFNLNSYNVLAHALLYWNLISEVIIKQYRILTRYKTYKYKIGINCRNDWKTNLNSKAENKTNSWHPW